MLEGFLRARHEARSMGTDDTKPKPFNKMEGQKKGDPKVTFHTHSALGENTLWPRLFRKRSTIISIGSSSFIGWENPSPRECFRRMTPPDESSHR